LRRMRVNPYFRVSPKNMETCIIFPVRAVG
jgi:hypothetical protein